MITCTADLCLKAQLSGVVRRRVSPYSFPSLIWHVSSTNMPEAGRTCCLIMMSWNAQDWCGPALISKNLGVTRNKMFLLQACNVLKSVRCMWFNQSHCLWRFSLNMSALTYQASVTFYCEILTKKSPRKNKNFIIYWPFQTHNGDWS